MDNPVDNVATWAPRRPLAGLALVVAVAAAACAVWFVGQGDAVGVFLMGVAAAILGYIGASALVIRPRLALTRDGTLVIRTVRTRIIVPRTAAVAVRELPHFGRRTPLLELDDGERLYALSRWDLGEHPAVVADALRAR